jgi:FkbM family methyltransferase
VNDATPLVPPAEETWSQSFPLRVARRIRWAVRDAFPRRAVTREVQGVTMTMPWSHRLPDYTGGDSLYGQNLVRLAERLARPGRPLLVLDIGANIGDSALQVLDATDTRVLCVEADEFYLDFLHTNTGADDRVVVEASLLQPDDRADDEMVPVRVGGTTRFTLADEPITEGTQSGTPTVTVTELRTKHPEFDAIRLVKSDTDGYEVQLVPAVAAAYAQARPVLFFEYDIVLTREAGLDPFGVWGDLARLGYAEVAIWDNGGRPLTRLPIGDMEKAAHELAALAGDGPASILRRRRASPYWDVAVVHGSDADGLAAISALVPVRT